MEVDKEADFIYFKKTKHRKKCPGCRKLIQDASKIHWVKGLVEKCYPIKGFMKFVRQQFWHEECWDGRDTK